MVIKQKLTPESFLEAPRRSAAVPNPDGTLAFFTVSTHTFSDGDGEDGDGKTTQDLVIVSLESGNTYTLARGAEIHDATWIPGDRHPSGGGGGGPLLWLESTARGQGDGETRMRVVTPRPTADIEPGSHYIAGVIPAPVQALKLCALEDGSVACAVVARAAPDGGMFNGVAAAHKKRESTARIYDGWNVREWDTYTQSHKHSIWYSKLVKDGHGRWKLAGPFQNALRGTELEAPDSMREDGDVGNAYDLGPKGVAFSARNPSPLAGGDRMLPCSDAHFLPLDFFVAEENHVPGGLGISNAARQHPQPIKISMPENAQEGWCSNVRFSPDGTALAFLKAPVTCYPDVRLFTAHIDHPPAATLSSGHSGPSLSAFDMLGTWDLRPSHFEYHPSGKSIIVTADESGCVVLYGLPLEDHAPSPSLLFRPRGGGSAHGFHAISDATATRTPETAAGRLLVSSSSLTESSVFQIVDCDSSAHDFEPIVLANGPRHRARFDLFRARQVSEIYFEGGGDYCVQAFIVRPSDFDASKKYPVVVVVHGGPVDASRDMWDMHWNPAVWAEQGYVVVLPNITGSVGFGTDFATGVFGEWGGRPYRDLANCMEYLKDIPYINMERAAVAGAGYGGYMVNWILGQPLARKFKAAVCQGGIFTLPQPMLLQQGGASDTGQFCDGGSSFPRAGPGDDLDRWNPARPDLLSNWAQAPSTLIVHGERDRRAPVTEALAAFRTLQVMSVPSRLLTFPDEGRWIEKPENALEWHRVLFDWLGRHIGAGPDALVVPDDAASASDIY